MSDRKGPTVLAIVCGWYPATAADNAGDGTHTYGNNIRVVAINCLGRLTPAHILRAFSWGADGVLIVGCALGECHYSNGNERCQVVVDQSRKLLDLTGIGGGRVGFHLTNELDGEAFTTMLGEFEQQIRRHGPLHGGRS